MKKLLLILLCFPLIGFGQTALDILTDGNNFHLLIEDLYKDHLIILEGKDDNSIQALLKEKKYSSKEEAIKVTKSTLLDHAKYSVGYWPIYYLNQSPVSAGGKKNYFQLYWRTAIESFPFVDDFTFRERFGYSYRNKLDYIYAALKHTIFTHEIARESDWSWIKGKGPNQYTFEDFATDETFKRNTLENLIEGFAKYTPFFLFLLMLWFVYRVDVSRNTNFINKYVYFGFIQDEKVQKRLRIFLITIFILPHILILLEILDNRDIFYISIFDNLSLSFLPNEKMYKSYLDFIECPIRVEWHRVIFANICLFISSYILTCMINFRNLKN